MQDFTPERYKQHRSKLPDLVYRKDTKMSGKYAFTKSLKEVRFLFCQTSEHSAATRSWLRRPFIQIEAATDPIQIFPHESIPHNEEEQPPYTDHATRSNGHGAKGFRQIWYATWENNRGEENLADRPDRVWQGEAGVIVGLVGPA